LTHPVWRHFPAQAPSQIHLSMAVLNSDLIRLCDKSSVPDVFRTWMASVGLSSPTDYACMTSEERDIRRDILDEAAKEGANKVDNATAPAVRVPAVKLWLACRQFLASVSKMEAQDEGLPGGIASVVQTAWTAKHGFELIGDLQVIATLLKKIYGCLAMQPRQVCVLYAEGIRMDCSLQDKDTIAQLEKTASGEARFKEVILDEVRGHFELFKRLRAYLFSVSYLAIDMGPWFTFQDAIFVSERLLQFIHQTQSGERRPSVQHFTAAWASTIVRMADIVKTTQVTLADAFKQSGQWEHYWTFVANSNSSLPSKLIGSASSDEKVTHELDKAREECRKLQSERDKATAMLKRPGRGEERGVSLKPNKEGRQPIKRRRGKGGGRGNR